MSNDDAADQHRSEPDSCDTSEGSLLKREVPPFLSKLSYASYIYGIKGILTPFFWLRDWVEYYNPPDGRPNIVKAYECRPGLPVRIFFPSSYDQTSPNPLPTLFTIHGGGFCLGHIRDDDEWNRAFADKHGVLVIALNYSKAPGAPFPTALYDLEALLLAVLADESLPIDRSNNSSTSSSSLPSSRTAILGFSAGGNLALSVSQLPRIRAHPTSSPPAAAVSIYGCLDLSVTPSAKLRNRPWKSSLPPPRGGPSPAADPLIRLAPAFDWGYIPYGHDLRDPLLSPHHAPRAGLPPFVGLVAAELDMLAHESWRLACRLRREGRGTTTGRGEGEADGDGPEGEREVVVVPGRESEDVWERVCGRADGEVSAGRGELVGLEDGKKDERFAFEETWEGGGGVKWLLVPDVLHGFDNPHIRAVVGGREAIEDVELKTEAYTAELARWLKEVVWRL